MLAWQGNLSGGKLSKGELVRGEFVRSGTCPQGHLTGGNLSGGQLSGGKLSASLLSGPNCTITCFSFDSQPKLEVSLITFLQDITHAGGSTSEGRIEGENGDISGLVSISVTTFLAFCSFRNLIFR